jgi:ATP-dependent DNA helicase RecG
LIAEAFYLTGDIEKYGSGFIRIRKELKEYPTMKIEFGEIPNGFLSTVSYAKQKTSLVENDEVVNFGDKVTDNQVKILQLIQKNERITTNELAIQLNISQRKIKENIAKLKEKEMLLRVGSSKSGYWKVTNANEI